MYAGHPAEEDRRRVAGGGAPNWEVGYFHFFAAVHQAPDIFIFSPAPDVYISGGGVSRARGVLYVDVSGCGS